MTVVSKSWDKSCWVALIYNINSAPVCVLDEDYREYKENFNRALINVFGGNYFLDFSTELNPLDRNIAYIRET